MNLNDYIVEQRIVTADAGASSMGVRISYTIRKTGSQGQPIGGYSKRRYWWSNAMGSVPTKKDSTLFKTAEEAATIVTAKLQGERYADIVIK
jgi:hypothetical protein